jgi:hypothetical protein
MTILLAKDGLSLGVSVLAVVLGWLSKAAPWLWRAVKMVGRWRRRRAAKQDLADQVSRYPQWLADVLLESYDEHLSWAQSKLADLGPRQVSSVAKRIVADAYGAANKMYAAGGQRHPTIVDDFLRRQIADLATTEIRSLWGLGEASESPLPAQD